MKEIIYIPSFGTQNFPILKLTNIIKCISPGLLFLLIEFSAASLIKEDIGPVDENRHVSGQIIRSFTFYLFLNFILN